MARLLRLLLRLPRSSAVARATDHDTSNRALFKYRDAVCVILATYTGARYNTYIHTYIHFFETYYSDSGISKTSKFIKIFDVKIFTYITKLLLSQRESLVTVKFFDSQISMIFDISELLE